MFAMFSDIPSFGTYSVRLPNIATRPCKNDQLASWPSKTEEEMSWEAAQPRGMQREDRSDFRSPHGRPSWNARWSCSDPMSDEVRRSGFQPGDSGTQRWLLRMQHAEMVEECNPR